MKVALFGASGMVGQGVLRECLLDPGVERVVSLVRRPTGQAHPRLQELVCEDFYDYASLEAQLTGLDACFFCLGVTSAGLTEAEYAHVTVDLTVAAATTLLRLNPALTFVFVSGMGTDSSERGKVMWARVKGRAENALLALPFKGAYMFRPGFIQPLHGARSRTWLYRGFYTVAGFLMPMLRALFPGAVTTTEQIGKGMLKAAREGAPKAVLETRDINAL